MNRYTPNTPNVELSDLYGAKCIGEALCNRSFYPVDSNGDINGPAVSTALYQPKQRPFWTSTVARFNANTKLGLPASASQNWYSDFGCWCCCCFLPLFQLIDFLNQFIKSIYFIVFVPFHNVLRILYLWKYYKFLLCSCLMSILKQRLFLFQKIIRKFLWRFTKEILSKCEIQNKCQSDPPHQVIRPFFAQTWG